MKILATSYGGSHVKTIEPVMAELVLRGHEVVYMPQTVAALSSPLNFKLLSFIDYADVDDPSILIYGEELAIKHHNSRVMPYESSVVYLGTLFKELVCQVGEDLAWQKYNEMGLHACTPVDYMKRLIDKVQPDFVIASNAPRMERALLNAAVIKGVPNICVIDFQGLREMDWLKSKSSCDAIAVNSRLTIDKLAEGGRDLNTVYLTGSPLFDEINESSIVKSAVSWVRKNKLQDYKKILFIAQPDFVCAGKSKMIREELLKICRERDYKLITRFHPSQVGEENFKFSDEIISPNSQKVEEVVNACDLCVTMTSTVGWMALLADKPLVVVNVSSTSQYFNITESDGALRIDSLEELGYALNLMLCKNATAKAMRKKRLSLPKFLNSARTIADIVEKIYWRKHV